jgi:HSP20 family protein
MRPLEPFNSALYEPFESLRREFGRFLPTTRPKRPTSPPLNVWSTDEGAVVLAEVPGLRPQDIELTVEGHRLILRGWPAQAAPQNATYVHRERVARAFERDLELPFEIKADKVEATLRDGILWIQLRRADEDQPRRITIHAA